MKVNAVEVLAALSCSVSVTAAFFTYDDCDDTCKEEFVSCTISEETKKFFLCHCIKSELACELQAIPVVVCLRPGVAPALGGAKIWNDFEKRNSSTTTSRPSPAPPPSPVGKRIFWKVLLSSSTLIIILIFLPFLTILSFMLRRKIQRRQYSEIRDSDNPYQSTIESLNEQ